MAVIIQIEPVWLEVLKTHVVNNEPIKDALYQPERIVGSDDVFVALRSVDDTKDLLRIALKYCPDAVREISLSLDIHRLYQKYGVADPD